MLLGIVGCIVCCRQYYFICYLILGDGAMVAHLALDQAIKVRVLVPQVLVPRRDFWRRIQVPQPIPRI